MSARRKGPARIEAKDARQRGNSGRNVVRAAPSADSAALSASMNMAENHDSRFAKATIRTIVGGLILAVIWASYTPIYELTSGTGTVRPEAKVERVEHLEGGIVTQIHVSAGSVVKKGDLIVTLDPRSVDAEITKLRAEETARRGELDRFRRALSMPDLAREIASGDGNAQDHNDAALLADLVFRAAQLEVLKSERRVIESERNGLLIRLEKLSEEKTLLQTQVTRYEGLSGSTAIPVVQREAVQRELLQIERNELSLQADAATLTARIEQSRLREAELEATNRREAAIRITDLEAGLTNLRESILQLEAQAGRTEVRSGISGTIQDLAIANPGEVVAPGDLIAEIVPLGSRLVAEIEVSADRIGGVAPGMDASLKVLTHDFTRYGDLDAEVISISPTSFLSEQGQTVFRVRIAFDRKDGIPTLGGRPILPGMTVSADIRSGEKTIIGYLLKPLRVLSDRAFVES